jgi:hypothetical protein
MQHGAVGRLPACERMSVYAYLVTENCFWRGTCSLLGQPPADGHRKPVAENCDVPTLTRSPSPGPRTILQHIDSKKNAGARGMSRPGNSISIYDTASYPRSRYCGGRAGKGDVKNS